MSQRIMTVSIRSQVWSDRENADQTYYTELDLPAKDYVIRDAMQRLRFKEQEGNFFEAVIHNCPYLPAVEHRRLDMPLLDELNFFAKRLQTLGDEERIALPVIADKALGLDREDVLVSMKDLINLTYGLDEVSVFSIVDDSELGQFVIENGINEDVKAVPESSRYLLDKAKIGKLQRESDGGVYVGGRYVLTRDYELPEVYDRETLPAEKRTDYAFRLKIAKSPKGEIGETEADALWVELPIKKFEANRIAKELGANRIEDCVYLDFESALPQIEDFCFEDMERFDALNSLAARIKLMSYTDEMKFKAILEATECDEIECMEKIAIDLREYDFSPQIRDAGSYFRSYLMENLHPTMSRSWICGLSANREGNELMDRIGVKETSYGFVAPKGHRLFESVSRNLIGLSEEFELIEVCGQTALFTNARIAVRDVGRGLYKYDLREGVTGFVSLEENVIVNHGGTVIVKEPIELGANGITEFDDESSPNFLGEHITLREFLERDYTESETNQIGGIKQ